jgi:pyruvate-formate lyase-activating enzyme
LHEARWWRAEPDGKILCTLCPAASSARTGTSRRPRLDAEDLRENTPDEIVALAAARGCPSIAYTYNDPVIRAEYVVDVARAARAPAASRTSS